MKIFSSTKQSRRGAANQSRVLLFIGFCAFLALANSCAQTKEPARKSNAETKTRAAAAPRVTRIDDAKIKELLKPGGKPLLVNFWATWCGPCREEFPDLVETDAEFRGKIDFFTVSLDFVEDIETTVPEFLREMNAEMPAYLLVSADENKLIASIAKDWSGGLPFTILYDENGEISYSRQGKVSRETLKDEIEKTLGEKR